MTAVSSASRARVSHPFEYHGYTRITHESWSRRSNYISLSDGAQIAADVYLPRTFIGQGSAPRQFPVIINLTPYCRAVMDPRTGLAVPNILSRPAEHVAGMEAFGGDSAGFVQHGYAMVVADLRNSGASYGPPALTFGKRYQLDPGEILGWVAAQSWCNGNIGMVGGSHSGWAQLAAASCGHPALKAIIPAVVPLEAFSGQFFPGGIYLEGFLENVGMSEEVRAIRALHMSEVSAPVDHQPVIQAPAKRIPFGHESCPYIDARAASGESGKDLCANLVEGIATSHVAIYNVGAWFDAFARGTCELYSTLEATNPSRMAMFPGYHDLVRGFMYDEFHVSVPDVLSEYRRFFDHYLCGINNGIDREPPVLIHVMRGDGWRLERGWPLDREIRKVLFAESGGRLSEQRGTSGSDSYFVPATHDRRYGSNLSSRWTALASIPPKGPPDMTRKDLDCVTYTSAQLLEPIEVTGHTIVKLWVSSTVNDGDFYAFLEEVDVNGRALMVAEGMLRAGFAGLRDSKNMTDTGMRILPDLPWHGYANDDRVQDILAGNSIVELTFDLTPVSWVFQQSSCIRLSIACANSPDFAANPATLSDRVVVKVHRGGTYATSLDIPVIPRN